MSFTTYAVPVGHVHQAGPPSPHGSIYAALPNTSPSGNVMYITNSPALAPGALPTQPTGQVYVQHPQQYIPQQAQQHHQQYIPQQAQTQLVHQVAAPYGPYVQGGPSPLLPMLPLSQQPSPQIACTSIVHPTISQGSNLIHVFADQQLPVPQYAVHPLLGQPQNRSDIWEAFRPTASVLNKMYNAVNLPATQPYQPEMRLVSADLPWTISIKAANGQYVTVGEVYEAIFNTLQGVVTHPEYRLTEPRTRKKMADQYQKRCTQYPLEPNEHARGIKRVDYLLHRNVFGGLKRDDKQAEELMMLNDQKMQYTWVLTFMSR